MKTIKKRICASTVAALLLLCTACEKTPVPAESEAVQAPVIVTAAQTAPTQEPETGLVNVLERALSDTDATCMLVINVGKADAILLTHAGQFALIDTGTEESAPQLLGALYAAGVARLDMVFLTHTHADHIGGFLALAVNVPIGQMYAAKYSQNKKNGENKISLLAEDAGLPLTRLSAGQTVEFAGTILTVLAPLMMNEEDDNDNSLVLQWSVNGRTFLLAGDMQFAEEATLLGAGAALASDVLKVGNHGNPDATSARFATAVSPSIAVISTDTAEDTDSANPAVIDSLSTANVYCTEGTPLGVCVSADTQGKLDVFHVSRPITDLTEFIVTEIDSDRQTVTVLNNGQKTADLSRCMLFSERGGELFVFPSGSMLDAGASLTVAAAGGNGDYTFIGEGNPWHKKKSDAALLYNPYGELLSRLAYGE